MMKKWLLGLFLMFASAFFAFPQKKLQQTETTWEMLEISDITDCRTDSSFDRRECRNYDYLTSGTTFIGLASLEWLKASGWEFVGVVNRADSTDRLYFKRRFDRLRTEREIGELKKAFEKSRRRSGLTDLDESEFQQQIQQFRQGESARLRMALEQTGNPALTVINVESNARTVKEPSLSAEIVLDATPVLLKKDGAYRASEADRYFNESVKQILEKIKVSSSSEPFGSAQRISAGTFKPVRIGAFRTLSPGISIKISVVINYDERQNIVAQGWIYGRWLTNPK